jgi:hypothetical protein
MMKEWKLKQEIYHRLNKFHDDDLKHHNICLENDIVKWAVKYFETDEIGWVYPAKSYVVGICYAKWISEDFYEDFYDILNDQDLLHGNDPYFVRYLDDKKTYDEIIKIVGLNFDCSRGVIPDIKEYYKEEINY